MLRSLKSTPKFVLVLLASVAFIASAQANEKVLYSFKGGNDGIGPDGALFADNAGNLFGVTVNGGTGTDCEYGGHCGTVFKLESDGSHAVLYNFQGGTDGAYPTAGMITDQLGNFYGTTSEGGTAGNNGTVFKLAADGTESVLYAFQGGSDGSVPSGGIIADSQGDFFGALAFDGDMSACDGDGCGAVFELTPNNTKITLHDFEGGNDGIEPGGALFRDSNGNLYGITNGGGGGGPNCSNGSSGCGTIFRITPDGTETILYAFQGGSDGVAPNGTLIQDGAGNLYGTTIGGGDGSCACGTVFKLATDGTETILYRFKGGNDGRDPFYGMIMDKSGNLYGTTEWGGGSGCPKDGRIGCGTVFELAADGTEKVLVSFSLKSGQYPGGPLLLKKGYLYGPAGQGGSHGDGVIFKVKK